MMKTKHRVTIKDIAQEAGVSTGTVHRALYGKKGVSAAVRDRILALCARYGYHANLSASALKHGPVRVAAAFPSMDGLNRFFYTSVWQGFHRCLSELSDYTIETVELPYFSGTINSQAAMLSDCLRRYGRELDALLTIGHFDTACRHVVQSYCEQGIPVFLACDDTKECGRLACVQSDYDATGRTVAELLSSQIPAGSSLLLSAGDVLIPSHYLTVFGFEDFLHLNRPDLALHKVNGYHNENEVRESIRQFLMDDPQIRGAFSVSARLSVLLAEEVRQLGLMDTVRVVASDLFEDTIENLRSGVVKNIIYKDPEQQAYLAARCMADYVLRGIRPLCEVQYVQSHIVFNSNLKFYI